MNSLPSPSSPSPHDHHAGSAWGLIGGALLGALIGIFIAGPLLLGTVGAIVGWLVGALIDRAQS